MAFTRPTLSALINRITADIDSKLAGATAALRRSVRRVFAKVFGGVANLMYGWLDYNKDQSFVTLSAVDDGLPEKSTLYGVVRKAAAFSGGDLVITGTLGTVIADETKLKRESDGWEYETDQAYTINGPIPVGGTNNSKVITVVALTAGRDGNEDADAVLQFVTTPANVDTNATVQSGGLTGGTDIETEAAWRARVLARKQFPSHGGTTFDYVGWMLENDNVTRAWCVPNYNAVTGAVGCTFVNDDEASGKILPSTATLETIRQYLLSHADPATGDTVGVPVGAREALTMIPLTANSQNYTIAISPYTDEVIDQVTAEIEAFYRRESEPGADVVLSRLSEAISVAQDEDKHRIVSPTSDPESEATELPSKGTLTFQAY